VSSRQQRANEEDNETMNAPENDMNANLESQPIVMDDGNVPWWWRLGMIAIVAFAAMHFAYFHLGTPGRTAIDRLDVALARNTELQYAEIGELKQDAPTMVKFLNEPSWLRVGQGIFKTNCVQCHGAAGEGKVGPNLGDDNYKNVRTIEDILTVLNRGAGGNAMPAWQSKLNSNEIVLVSTYVASLRGTKPTGGKGPEGQIIPPWPTANEVQAISKGTAEAEKQ
jgi:cytochrome c oxidase cbb3-type subunit III